MGLDDNVVTKKPAENKNHKLKPTDKQVAYLKKLAGELGERVKESDLETLEAASKAIEKLQQRVGPTDKQLKFAEKLADEQGISIPDEAKSSRKKMGEWITKVLSDE